MVAARTPYASGLLAWWRRHRLSLTGLSTPTRRLATAALVVAGLAASAVLVLTARTKPAEIACSPLTPSSRAAGDIAVLVGADALALVAIGSGTVFIALAGSAAGWRFPRLRFVLLAVLAAVVPGMAVLIYPYRPLAEGGWLSLPLIAGWPLAALATLITVCVATHGRGPRRAAPLALVLGAPFVSIFLSAAGTRLMFGDPCAAVRQLNQPMPFFSAISGLAVFALLLWLAVDGLRLSGDLGTWLLGRFPGPRLVNGILLAKAVGFLVVLLLIRQGLMPEAPQVDAIWGTLLAALPATVLIMLLLFQEKRLVRVSADRFSHVMRIFGAVVAIWIGPLMLSYALPVLDAALAQRLPVLMALLALVLGAGVIGWVVRRDRGRAWWVVAGPVALVSVVVVGWSVSHPVSAPGSRLSLLPSYKTITLLIVVPALGVIVGLLVLAFRPRLRAYRAFIVAGVGWLILTQVVPAAAPALAITGTGLDVTLLIAAIAVFLLHRRGRLHSVTDQELILLLITTTLLLELPALVDRLPAGWGSVLLMLALLGPGLTTLNLDSEPLNERRGTRPQRVIGTIGVLTLAYGMLLSAALLGRDSLVQITQLSDLFAGYVTLPIAVVLVAAHSLSAASGRPELAAP